jgi:hypothetical protein
MIYVLLAIALFGILTATLSSQNNQSDGQDIDDEMVELYANELIEYAAAAKQVVDQMLMTGSSIDDLDFINPESAGFDTPPHIHKVFHPQGGGLNYVGPSYPPFDEAYHPTYEEGWHILLNNVEWTPSTATDILFSAFFIEEQVCAAINKQITGSETIPVHAIGGYGPNAHFAVPAPYAAPIEFTSAECPECEGYPSLCMVNTLEDSWTFYNIIAAR